MKKFKSVWMLLCISSLLVGGGASAAVVAAGDDVMSTPPGGASHDFSGDPIPADFFGPGSDPFFGIVPLQGAGTGCFDTVVSRLNDASPLPIGGQATIPIEIVELNLVSSAPIQITPQNDFWDVHVDLSQFVPQPGGQMTIKHQNADGGTYDSTQDICPRMTFTQIAPPFDVRVLDICFDQGLPAAVTVGTADAPWSHNVQLPLNCPNSSPDFRAEGPHTGPHPEAQPVEDLVPEQAPALGPIGMAIALGMTGTLVALRRRRAQQ